MAAMIRRMRTFAHKYFGKNMEKGLVNGHRGKLTAYAQADPLLLSRRSCFDNSLVKLLVAFADIHLSILCFLVDYFDSRLLLYNSSIHLLEKLGKFGHLSFDVLDFLVSVIYSLQCGLRLPLSIAVYKLMFLLAS